MKSRHMTPKQSTARRFWRSLPWLAVIVLACAVGSVHAQQEADPPGRVAHLSYRQGSVVFAPQGDDEWLDLPQNRPLTSGDRLWSDRGARAELQLGAATLHVDGQSHLGVGLLEDNTAQFILQQGSVHARVRELQQGENFEIDTPNLALRATQPGAYRIDVDSTGGQTRVTVQSGLVTVFGEGGQPVQLGAGQQVTFAGRYLAQVQAPQFLQDDFGLWAAERDRLEDQSIAARHVPRGVVGYPELDQHGSWAQDPTLGAVWYPSVTVADWAPYRYGQWAWIEPWGWTWIDDAPWGFAPFHYGRWTSIANRWAWVPGRMAARPLYSPALVVFLGGGGSRFSVSSGPAVGWYPLAPGEAWWPTYRTSPRYVNWANHDINLHAYPRHFSNHLWRQRPYAVTAVREDDFRRGRPVNQNWQRVQPQMMAQAQIGVVPMRPDGRRERDLRAGTQRLQAVPPTGVQPAIPTGRLGDGREAARQAWSGREAGRELPPLVREQQRAQFEQERLQRDAERTAREQQRQQEQVRRQQGLQPDQAVRQQPERAQREAWQQRQQQEQVQRRQQEQVQLQRQQQDQAQLQRQQQDQAVRQQQEWAQREAWRQRQQQEQAGRQETWQRQRPVAPPQAQPAQLYRVQPASPQQLQPAPQPQLAPGGRGPREGGGGRWQREAEDNGGRGGRGPWGRG
jgi:hypothetical protein